MFQGRTLTASRRNYLHMEFEQNIVECWSETAGMIPLSFEGAMSVP